MIRTYKKTGHLLSIWCIILMLAILFIVPFSSAFDFDNSKSYNPTTKTATITNSFGLGDTIADLTLVDNTYYCLNHCSATLDLNLYSDYTNPLKEFDIYNLEKTRLKSIKHLEILVGTPVGFELVNDYGTVCHNETLINKNDSKEYVDSICKTELIGTHYMTIYKYQNYDKIKKISAGNYRIKIEGIKNTNESVDWIITDFMGISIPEWASWSSSWDVGNVAYWNMSSQLEKRNPSHYNLTNTGTAPTLTTTAAWLNRSSNFSGAVSSSWKLTQNDNWVTFNYSSGSNFTINMWVRYSNQAAAMALWGGRWSTGVFLTSNWVTPKRINTRGFGTGADCVNTIDLSLATWYMVTVTRNGTHVCLFINGTDDINCQAVTGNVANFDGGAATIAFGSEADGTQPLNGMMDEIGVWNRSLTTTEIIDLYNGHVAGFSPDFSFDYPSELPVVTLNYPKSGIANVSTQIFFNCTASQGASANITNISLYTNISGTWSLNQTKSFNTNYTSATFNISNIVDGLYRWNCLAYNNNSNFSFATDNETFRVDTINPSINLISPKGSQGQKNIPYNLDLNYSIYHPSGLLDSCWYNTSYNSTINFIAGCANITFSVSNQSNNNTLWFYANDTANNLGINTTNWIVDLVQGQITYSNSTTSGATEPFTSNITFSDSFSGISVLLNYNNTNYTMTASETGSNRLYYYNLLIPSVTIPQNKSFYFIYLLANSSGLVYYNSSTYNQTINPFLIDNCTSFNNTIINFTMIDEEYLTPMNGTILVNLKVYSFGNLNNLINGYNTTFNYVIGQDSRICLANISRNYTMTYEIQHYGNSSYFKKYRNMQNMTINNQTLSQNITLYNLMQTSGNTYQIILVGNLANMNGNSNLLVESQRQYINLDSFYLVESSVTSSESTAILHLTSKTQVYNFVISYNGQILGTFNNYNVQCQNELTGQCTITLNLAQSTGNLPDFHNYGNITQIFLLDDTTHTLTQTFYATDGNAHIVQSLVLKNDAFGNTTICNNTIYGTSGTFTCLIPAIYQNTTFFVQTFVDGLYVGSEFFSQGQIADWMGADIFIELIMFSSIVLLFIAHPITIVIGAILAFFAPLVLLYIAGTTITNVILALAFYGIAGGIIIWQIGRKN